MILASSPNVEKNGKSFVKSQFATSNASPILGTDAKNFSLCRISPLFSMSKLKNLTGFIDKVTQTK